METTGTCATCGTEYADGQHVCTAEPTVVAGRYVLEERLSEGGSGLVYRALDRNLRRPIALKILRGVDDPERARRLFEEAGVIARLSHPNIVRLHDLGRLPDGSAFLALDWVDGLDLAAVLAAHGGRLPPPDAIAVAIALADALAAAHADGVLHRDVKPSNVLVPRRGERLVFDAAKLADFGVHGLLTEQADDGTMTTRAGPVVGSPAWMAPEQLLGARNTTATDLFGLGAVLFQMVFGTTPGGGTAAQEVIVARLTRAVTIPDAPALPAGFRELLAQLLDREPTRRPDSAAAVRDELLRLRRTIGDVAPRPVPAIDFAAPPPPVAAPAPGAGGTLAYFPASSPPTRAARRALPAVVGTTFALAVAAGMLVGVLVLARGALSARPSVMVPPRQLAIVVQPLVALALGALLFATLTAGIDRRRRVLATRAANANRSVEDALLGDMPLDRDGISRTVVTTVEAILQRCRELDERLIGQTIVAIAREYASDASTPDTRLQALVEIPKQLEVLSQKIAARSTPWYVRHEKLLAAAVSATAVAGGLAKTVLDVMAMVSPK